MKKSRKKKRKVKFTKYFVCLLMLVVSGLLIYSGAKELKTTADIRVTIQEDKDESAALDEKQEELENTKENLTNPDYVEYLARGKYLVTKDGEQVFKFSDDE